MKQRKSIKMINYIVDFMILMIIILVLAFAGYSLWDSDQVHRAADSSNYKRFRPSIEDEGKSFSELQEINPEVIAWLNVYGTNIDYPVTQGTDNMKYVSTNAEGLFSLSGAIFLDSNNNSSFKDFSSILYGHHMERQTMFGELGGFWEKEMFENHRYGNIFFDGRDHGIQFFAFVHTDAYNRQVFNPRISEEAREEYLENLLVDVIYDRDIGVSVDDNIILLTTCSSRSTNGRDILVGRITDEVFENPFLTNDNIQARELSRPDIQFVSQREIVIGVVVALLLALMIIVAIYYLAESRRRGKGT